MSFARLNNVVSFVEPGLFDAPPPAWAFKNDICELEPRAYSLVMIDPAWTFRIRSNKGGSKSPQSKYKCMSREEIAALPVADLAHPEGCMFWVWGTHPMIHEQCDIIRDGWGLKIVTSGVWVKTTKNGKVNFGTGYVLRGSSEPFFICSLPNTKIDYGSKSQRGAILSRIRDHSQKPEEAYQMARALIPYGRAADVFTRTRRPGWEPFGDQLDTFDFETGERIGNDAANDAGRSQGGRTGASRRRRDRQAGESPLPFPRQSKGIRRVAAKTL